MPERAEIEAVLGLAVCATCKQADNVYCSSPFHQLADRVRDARDDEDGARVRDENAAALDALADHPKRGKLGARSPQGEDHGPEPDALGGLPPSQPKEDDERRH